MEGVRECEACGVSVGGGPGGWEAHERSRPHVRRAEQAAEFQLNERDMFVDQTSAAYQLVRETKGTLHGAEFLLHDRGSGHDKCLLCKALLKEPSSVLPHFRSHKHSHFYLKTVFPELFADLQRKARSRADQQQDVLKYADLLARRYGKDKVPRVHQRGFYDALSEDRRREVDQGLAEKMIHMDHCRRLTLRQLQRSPSPRRDSHRDRDRRDRSRDRDRRERSRERGRERRDERRDREESWRREPSDDRRRGPGGSDEEAAVELLAAAEVVGMGPGERAVIQDLIDAVDGSVVGMGEVREYSDALGRLEPGYFCALCRLRLSPPAAVEHSLAEAHAMAFLKAHRQKHFMALCIGTLGEEVRRQMKARYLEEASQEPNARLITHKLRFPNGDPPAVFQGHQRILADLPPPVKKVEERREKAPSSALPRQAMDPFARKDLRAGWVSLRCKSMEFYRRRALAENPSALYFSLRRPGEATRSYGDWNPQLMRRLQDKFNFSQEHMESLQELLIKHGVPTHRKLELSLLRPLEVDVEASVLTEMADQVLKPVDTLRYMQVFEYNCPPPEQPTPPKPQPDARLLNGTASEDPDRREDGRRDHGHRRKSLRREEKGGEKRGPVSMKLETKPQPRLRHNPDVAAKLAGPSWSEEEEEVEEEERRSKRPKRDKAGAQSAAAEAPPDGMEAKLYAVIDSVLAISSEEGEARNPILAMLAEFPDARRLLFALATQQPQQLQHLVALARSPRLALPSPDLLHHLRANLAHVHASLQPAPAPAAQPEPSLPFFMQQGADKAPPAQPPQQSFQGGQGPFQQPFPQGPTFQQNQAFQGNQAFQQNPAFQQNQPFQQNQQFQPNQPFQQGQPQGPPFQQQNQQFQRPPFGGSYY